MESSKKTVMPQRKLVCLVAGLLLGATAFAQSSSQKKAPPKKPAAGFNFADMAARIFTPGPAPDPAAVARGQKIFAPTCGFCHGPDATGRSAPDLVASSLVIRDDKGNVIGPVIHKGRPGKGMPAFSSLTNAQIADISAFLHSRIRAAANRFAYSLKEVVTGNPQLGKAYFDGAGKCSSCHSPTGDLAGIATRVQAAQLQAQMLDPEPDPFFGGGKPVTEQVSVTLPSGETVTGTLLSRDHFRITLRDAAGGFHSLPAAGARVETTDPLAAHKAIVNTITDDEMHNLLAYLETLK